MKDKTIEKNTLTLRPNDYIIFNGGLEVRNNSSDNVITIDLPTHYSVKKFKKDER